MTEVNRESPDRAALYGHRARYYDLIYHWKQYEQEAERIHVLLEHEGIGDGSTLLDAACGTGSHLQYLKRWYSVSGFDASESMLRVARDKMPGVTFDVADLRSFTVGEPRDVVSCLFSSIGYLHTDDELSRAATCLAASVRAGGVLMVEPWLAPETFVDGHPSMTTYSSDDLKLGRFGIGRIEGDLSILDFHWCVAERDAGDVEQFVERHALRLCPYDTLRSVFEDAGFDCRMDEKGLGNGRHLLVGRRR